jgi:hypothetical protein
VTDLRPPPQHDHMSYHWLIDSHGVEYVARWHPIPQCWTVPGVAGRLSPSDNIIFRGDTYSRPVDPAAIMLDPNDERVTELIRAGCGASDIHLGCSYPECSCTQVPATIRAVIEALKAPPAEQSRRSG